MTELEQRAKEFATFAHKDQTRRYTNEPYIVHPEQVADLVRSVLHTEEMLAAAWLHDTVEDCGVTSEEIEKLFGPLVRIYVGWLTDVSKPSDGNRKVRKEMDRLHAAMAPAEVMTIKIADLISNSLTITQCDPGFAQVYIAEKQEMLKVLTKGDPTLWNKANEIVEEYYNGKREQ